MSDIVLEITEDNFETEVLNSKEPVLVDFWAPWCGPCRQIAPVVEQLADEYQGSVKVGKINVDDAQHLAGSYGVQSIPTLMIFKGGQVIDQFVGLQGKPKLQAALDAAKG